MSTKSLSLTENRISIKRKISVTEVDVLLIQVCETQAVHSGL